MKKAILGLALLGCALACKSNQNTTVADPSTANMPKKACCVDGNGDCPAGKKACCQQAQQQPQN